MIRRREFWIITLVGLVGLVILLAVLGAVNLAPTVVTSATPIPATLDSSPTVAPVDTATMAPTPMVARPSPTVAVTQYTVVTGDTLWDIAVRFDVSLDEIIGANPGIDPELLHPGDVIRIPGIGTVDVSRLVRRPTATPDMSQPVASMGKGRVVADGDGLRLRKGPSTSEAVIAKLDALTPLTILRRSADGAWLEVALQDGTRGWVMIHYVDTNPGTATQLEAKPGPIAPLTAPSLPRSESYISGFTTRAKEIFRAGQAMGNHANVFANIGDSNSASPLFLEPFDNGYYDLGEYGYLADTIRYFRGSFRFTSVAAVVGFDAIKLRDPARADPNLCRPGGTPLACEYRLKKPSVALILIGTNDSTNWQYFEANYRPIIEYTISKGIVPVLITKGDDLESTKYNGPPNYINGVIAKLSREYGVPLLDLHQVVAGLPANGFGSDGFHYNVPPDGKTAFFTGFHLNYGYTIHNLTVLQALDAVRRLILNS